MRTTLLLAVCVSAALAGDPPPPSLEKPVDYLAWRKAEFGGRVRDNAAPLYEEAIAKFVENEEVAALLGKTPFAELSAAQQQEVAAWVASNAAALEKFAEAAKKRDCWFEGASSDGSLVGLQILPYSGVRKLARVLAVRAEARRSEGDVDGAMDDALVILASARHSRSQPEVISHLVGIAISATAYEVIARVVNSAPVDTDWNGLFVRLKRGDRQPVDLSRALQGDLAWSYDAFQRFMRDTDGDGRLDLFALPEVRGETGDMPLKQPRALAELATAVRDSLELVRQAQSLRGSGYREKLDQYEKRISADPDLWTLANISRIEQQRRRCDVMRRGTFILLKLHAFKAAGGSFPATLREAMTGEDPTLCWDPFSDEDLVYRVTGKDFLLYSVGANGRDDRGNSERPTGADQPNDPLDTVIWPVPK